MDVANLAFIDQANVPHNLMWRSTAKNIINKLLTLKVVHGDFQMLCVCLFLWNKYFVALDNEKKPFLTLFYFIYSTETVAVPQYQNYPWFYQMRQISILSHCEMCWKFWGILLLFQSINFDLKSVIWFFFSFPLTNVRFIHIGFWAHFYRNVYCLNSFTRNSELASKDTR